MHDMLSAPLLLSSIERLSHVVGHHIEACAKLQYELLVDGTDFYLSAECPATRSTPTAFQLESLHRQLCIAAPSGLMSSLHFRNLLMDIISVNMGRNPLPEPWMNKNETQLLEMVSLMTDAYELIDWRRFLLSAALPWPFPSLSQLLVVLQRFQAADTGATGFVTEAQYRQTQLWSGIESVQLVPEDPSKPRPHDRLAHLHKFFFQLFVDPYFFPPRLDYVYMLQHFAADPKPRQGFIRALSVVLGQHLLQSSPGHLVKSLPRIDKLSSSGLDGDHKEEDFPCACSGSLGDKEVSISTLLAVTCHKVTRLRDGSPLPPGCLSREEHAEQLVRVFGELGYRPEDCAPFSALAQHPFIQGLMETSTQYQLVNIHELLLANQDEVPEG